MSEFYIDVDKAQRLGIISKVKVKLNGAIVGRVARAKSGNNGFVEFLKYPLELSGSTDELVTIKRRGLVKISINKAKK